MPIERLGYYVDLPMAHGTLRGACALHLLGIFKLQSRQLSNVAGSR